MNYVQLLEQVKEELIHFFQTHENPLLSFHNLDHTKKVVANAGQIGRHYQLNDHDFFVLETAAWFHDAGYYIHGASGHEITGASMAEEFLKKRGVDEKTREAVSQCILATLLPQSPKNLIEQILCDADLYHFGTDDFPAFNKLMRKEAESRAGEKIPKAVWRKSTINLLESHQFKTEYARNLLQETKRQNIIALKEKEIEKEKETEVEVTAEITDQQEKKKAMETTNEFRGQQPEVINKKQKDPERPSRGIETMFRISSGNHQRLSDMADNKAHIMITTTSIILSVLLSLLLRKLEDNPNLILPTMILLVVCVVTMVFAIIATRPTLPNGIFTEQDITNKTKSLLFFGNFYRMSYNDYSNGMEKLMSDREFLYGNLTRDVYSQGIVLGRKYRLLRLAYNIFMYGIIVSVLAFILAVTLFN